MKRAPNVSTSSIQKPTMGTGLNRREFLGHATKTTGLLTLGLPSLATAVESSTSPDGAGIKFNFNQNWEFFRPDDAAARTSAAAQANASAPADAVGEPASPKCCCNRRPAKLNCCRRCRRNGRMGKSQACARDGFVLDENWRGGELTSTTIYSAIGGTATVRYGGQTREIKIPRNGSAKFIP